MEKLSKKLNFSDQKENDSAIKIKKWGNVNHYDTLRLYCSDNDINLDNVSDDEFSGCEIIMNDYGTADKTIDYYYFWIDND